MRITLIAVAALAASVLGAGAPAAAGTTDTADVGTFQYVVEPDLRKCASPLCGGYWVGLANHRRTACSDGVLRRRCYVALAADSRRHELRNRVAPGAIVRADLESRDFGLSGELGFLVVADVRVPAGSEPSGPFFRVRDLGIRCVRAPCFSLRAARLNKPDNVTLSGIDLRPAGLSERDESRAEAALAAANGLFVSGKVVPTGDGGKTLRVSRVYLRGATPRG